MTTKWKSSSQIKCRACLGSKKNTIGHPSHHKSPCGFCSGTGVSHDKFDQPRNGSTVGMDMATLIKMNLPFTQAGMQKALQAESTLEEIQVHSDGTLDKDRGRITGILISWKNQDYVSRLEDARKDGLLS